MIVKQGDKEFFSMQSCGRTVYYVSSIKGKNTTGKQGSYQYLKCDICGRILGTQFNGFGRHMNTHNNKK